ncbi:MAG: hypothetical protein IH897_05110 [Planctomycetes bacterium]|nr:hypothetical protein [Planctomycetota bacterium]
MEIASTQELLRDLERKPERVQLHKTVLEETIAWCMDEIHRLAHGRRHVRRLRCPRLSCGSSSMYQRGYDAPLIEQWRKRI